MGKVTKTFKRTPVTVKLHPLLVPIIDAIAAEREVDRSDELRRIIEMRAMKYALEHAEKHPEAAKLARLTLEDASDSPKEGKNNGS